ncbi:dimethylarginine dimethylaminohydrolase [Maritimibacter sp. 55A14]|uniref:dimethylarginine dimethylaminohydrolase family protein n=1 Tax=Maritimibacter sp. 55A14 TaxID=2174844 RepID=UPI000D610802|nr:dimethylarginine dimethylaminohydrolase [Maritimibacter sp. 55A14]PWE34031.1 dimethylarginine dimethylaminohydrolase [Maritimibacter sp. 55A14]
MTRFDPCHFTHAITRGPAASIARGLRAGAGEDPDPATFAREHTAYVEALRAAGAEVIELEPLDAHPDSVFVEDPALCLGDTAILLRPGAPSRFGERDAIRPTLEALFETVIDLPEGGFVDGGDILTTGAEVLVGRSARTDAAGVAALAPLTAALGLPLRVVQTPPEILHFKTECGLLDRDCVFATRAIAETGCFESYRVILAPEGEEAAANLIRFNDKVFVSAGYPKTAALLRAEGFDVAEIATSQAARVDGGLSCMSLRCTISR